MLGLFDSAFPWLHLAALLVFAGWYLNALRIVQKRAPALDEPGELFDYAARKHASRRHAAVWTFTALNRPHSSRYILALVALALVSTAWMSWGKDAINSINPGISKKWRQSKPAMNAWIAPPEYTHLPPVMLATPAEVLQNDKTLSVPSGSVVKAYIAGSGSAPGLQLNGESYKFTPDGNNGYSISQKVDGGRNISINRGWRSLGYWRIKVLPDKSPKISFFAPPSVTERKTIQLSYLASDDYGIDRLALVIEPAISAPGVSLDPITIPLPTPLSNDLREDIFKDLTSSSLAGLPVTLRLQATDSSGNEGLSDKVSLKLPERAFRHPLASALIEERKLLLMDDSKATRNETANIMAGIAHQPGAYNRDPVVLMALRTGAVRLILDQNPETLPIVSDLLWQAAIRIEEGAAGQAHESLIKRHNELALAFDRNANENEVQLLIEKLQQALFQYMAALESRKTTLKLDDGEDKSIAEDFSLRLEQLRGLSAGGLRKEARNKLGELQRLWENIKTEPLKISPQQKHMLQQQNLLKGIAAAQQKLIEAAVRTENIGKNPEALKRLAEIQQRISKQLKSVLDRLNSTPVGLLEGAHAMDAAVIMFKQSDIKAALQSQHEALRALRKGIMEIVESEKEAKQEMPPRIYGGKLYNPDDNE